MFASKQSYHGIPTKGHLHHSIPTRVHLHHSIPTRVHLHHGILSRRHLHHGIPIRGHLHHDIPTRSICIMTYPLEDIYTTRFLHLHLCKETFASRLNICADTIKYKLCICTPAWDICIMKVASLKRDMSIIWTFRICILVRKHLHQK